MDTMGNEEFKRRMAKARADRATSEEELRKTLLRTTMEQLALRGWDTRVVPNLAESVHQAVRQGGKNITLQEIYESMKPVKKDYSSIFEGTYKQMPVAPEPMKVWKRGEARIGYTSSKAMVHSTDDNTITLTYPNENEQFQYYQVAPRIGGWATVTQGAYGGIIGQVTDVTPNGGVVHITYSAEISPSAVPIAHRGEFVVGLSSTPGVPRFDSVEEAERWMERTADEQWLPQAGAKCRVRMASYAMTFQGEVQFSGLDSYWPAMILEVVYEKRVRMLCRVQFFTKDGLCAHEHWVDGDRVSRYDPAADRRSLADLQEGGCIVYSTIRGVSRRNPYPGTREPKREREYNPFYRNPYTGESIRGTGA